ncbi:11902_t:CDS:2, partial [Funneliformis mosseae]
KVAKACKTVFKSSYIVTNTYNDYILLRKDLEQAAIILLKVFGSIFSNLLNLHILCYLPDIATNFRTLVNVSVSLKEARDNTLQTLRYLLDSRLDVRYNKVNLFIKFIRDTILHKLLDSWYIGVPSMQANIKNENIIKDNSISI